MRSWLLLSTCLFLAACTQDAPELDVAPEGFGVAVRHNMEAQIVNPKRPVTALGPAPGERRALAAERYQADRVETPVEVYTIGE